MVKKRNVFVNKKGYRINRFKIETLSDYLDLVRFIESKQEIELLWFRGVTKVSYRLIPGIYRGANSKYNRIYENDISYGFIRKAKAYTKVGAGNLTKWEWFHIMQHYGIPTRFLDWTESALIGIFYAVRRAERNSSPCVWVLDPFWLNEEATGQTAVFFTDPIGQTEEDEIINAYCIASQNLPKFPVGIHPPWVDERMKAQHASFTIHGSLPNGIHIQSQKSSSPRLFQLQIKKRSIERIRKELFISGIRESTIYPDMGGLAIEIKDHYRYS